jgi:simple sugar transport system permease protein
VSDRERWRRYLRRLVTASAAERLLISVAAILLSIFVGVGLVLVSGWVAACRDPAFVIGGAELCYDPIEVYTELFVGAIGGNPLAQGWDPLGFAVALTLKEVTLLVFTGLSVAVAFRAGMFNIGTQGQLVLGALATALVALFASRALPANAASTAVVAVLALAAGAVAGGLYGALPGALKAYAEANEVITTIMLNFIAARIAFLVVDEYFRNPASNAVETTPLPDFALLPAAPYALGDGFSPLALGLGLVLVVAIYYLLMNTPFGYDLRTSGIQPKAAEYGGLNAERTMVASMTISGALAGLGGAIWVLMVMGKFQDGVPGLGFDGITVSILAGNNPLGVPLAALLFGTLKSGSLAVEFSTGVPKQLVEVLRGLIILFVAMPEFFRMIGRRFVSPVEPTPTSADGSGEPGERGRRNDHE